MDWYILTLAIVGIFALLSFIYLFFLLNTKLYTYDEVKYDIPGATSILPYPIIYEVAYVSKTGANWNFTKDFFTDGIMNMTHDFKNNRINYVIINSNLYKIESVQDNISDKIIFKLTPSCVTEGSFTSCGIENIVGNNAYTVLHIIGYWVA